MDSLSIPASADLFDWPSFGLVEDVRPALAEARARGRTAVLATLYAVDGGAPRGVGAQMAFDETGPLAGFLSGGCVEADVALHAQAVLADGESRRLTYGDGGPVDIALPCGSRIDVLLEPIRPDDPALAALLAAAADRRLARWRSDGRQRTCTSPDAPDPGAPALVDLVMPPPLRAIVVGADPAALATARLLQEAGVETRLVRPKGPAAAPPFPVADYRRDAADAVIAQLRPDPWTAVCVMTHDTAVEQAAVAAALRTDAGYVGVLGSRRRGPERVVRLRAEGFDDPDLARLHAPIGLPIGGKAPWHIAIAVAAEVVQTLTAGR